jgi:hypothetical protein
VERNITPQTKLIMQKITDEIIDCDIEKILYTDQSHPDIEIINLELAENYCHASKFFLENKMYRFNNMD